MPSPDAQGSTPGDQPARRLRTARSLAPYTDYRPAMPFTDPAGRILFGSMIILAAAWAGSDETVGRLSYWMVLIAFFGVAMIVSGIRQQKYETQVRTELHRAEREWEGLMRDASSEQPAGHSLSRFLEGRGYRQFWVRRMLAARLERDLLRRADATRSDGGRVPE